MDDTGKYLTVWKKQPDGNWKIVRDIFNSDKPGMWLRIPGATLASPPFFAGMRAPTHRVRTFLPFTASRGRTPNDHSR